MGSAGLFCLRKTFVEEERNSARKATKPNKTFRKKCTSLWDLKEMDTVKEIVPGTRAAVINNNKHKKRPPLLGENLSLNPSGGVNFFQNSVKLTNEDSSKKLIEIRLGHCSVNNSEKITEDEGDAKISIRRGVLKKCDSVPLEKTVTFSEGFCCATRNSDSADVRRFNFKNTGGKNKIWNSTAAVDKPELPVVHTLAATARTPAFRSFEAHARSAKSSINRTLKSGRSKIFHKTFDADSKDGLMQSRGSTCHTHTSDVVTVMSLMGKRSDHVYYSGGECCKPKGMATKADLRKKVENPAELLGVRQQVLPENFNGKKQEIFPNPKYVKSKELCSRLHASPRPKNCAVEKKGDAIKSFGNRSFACNKELKEQECRLSFQKMTSKGICVSLDTLLRGLLTPMEYRLHKNEILKSGECEWDI